MREGWRGGDGSHVFIMFGSTPHLNGKHAVFGKVIIHSTVERTWNKLASQGQILALAESGLGVIDKVLLPKSYAIGGLMLTP